MAMNTAIKTGPRGRPFTLLGAMLAGVSLILFALVSTSLGGGHTPGPALASSPVVVLARAVAIRSQLQADDLTVGHWSATDIPPGAFTRVQDAVNMVAAVNLVRGEPLTSNLVSQSPDLITGGQGNFLPIPEGFVALTLPISDLNGVAGFIQQDDYIEVVVQTTAPGGLPKIQTVFTNLHVIRLGPATDQPAASPVGKAPSSAYRSYSEITVVATQCDAQFLYWFEANATVKFTLASYHDYQPADTQPDPTCPNVSAAKGITKSDVDNRWPGLVA